MSKTRKHQSTPVKSNRLIALAHSTPKKISLMDFEKRSSDVPCDVAHTLSREQGETDIVTEMDDLSDRTGQKIRQSENDTVTELDSYDLADKNYQNIRNATIIKREEGYTVYNVESTDNYTNFVQHLVQVSGCSISIYIEMQGLYVKGNNEKEKAVPYNICINRSRVLLLLDILGYKNEDIDMDALVYNVDMSGDSDTMMDDNHDITSIESAEPFNNVSGAKMATNSPRNRNKKPRINPLVQAQGIKTEDDSAPIIDNDIQDNNNDHNDNNDPDSASYQSDATDEYNYTDDINLLLKLEPLEYQSEDDRDRVATKLPNRRRRTSKKGEVEKRFQCPECVKCFASKKNLQAHIRTHSGDKPYHCTECGRNFTQLANLNAHIRRTHRAERHFSCTLCTRSFVEKRDLIVHTRIHTGERPFQCTTCGRKFNQKAHLKGHMRTHSGEKPYLCSLCGKSFTESGSLKKHRNRHMKERKCGICGEEFEDKDTMKLHMENSHDLEKQCVVCRQEFADKTELKLHMETIHGATENDQLKVNSAEKEKPLKCVLCDRSFAEKRDLAIHTRIHTGEKPYQCTVCGRAFRQNGHLKSHMLTHTGEKPFLCTVCGRGFGDRSSLKNHRRIHSGERPHVCLLCFLTFPRKDNLNDHMKTHTGERPYQCDECGQCFAYKGGLRNHRLKHSGVKAFQCSECGMSFARKSDVKNHSKIHTGIKPYQCDICGRSFAQKNGWKIHKRTHTDVKPFQCEVCAKCFAQRCTLKLHARIHTGETPYRCDQCGLAFGRKDRLNVHMRVHATEINQMILNAGDDKSHSGIPASDMSHVGNNMRPQACHPDENSHLLVNPDRGHMKTEVGSPDEIVHTTVHSNERSPTMAVTANPGQNIKMTVHSAISDMRIHPDTSENIQAIVQTDVRSDIRVHMNTPENIHPTVQAHERNHLGAEADNLDENIQRTVQANESVHADDNMMVQTGNPENIQIRVQGDKISRILVHNVHADWNTSLVRHPAHKDERMVLPIHPDVAQQAHVDELNRMRAHTAESPMMDHPHEDTCMRVQQVQADESIQMRVYPDERSNESSSTSSSYR